MITPELWDFPPPPSTLVSNSASLVDVSCFIQSQQFNNLISITLPDTVQAPEHIKSLLTEDCEFYSIKQLPLAEFVKPDFINAFVKRGKLLALSSNARFDVEDCFTFSEEGDLKLSVQPETYQTLGLEGQTVSSKTSTTHARKKKKTTLKMAPKKEVLTLKDLAMTGVSKYLECALVELMAIVCEISKRDETLGYSFLKTSLTQIGNYVFESVSCDVVDSVVQCILTLLPRLVFELRDTYMKCFCPETFMIRMRTVVLLANILLHPKVHMIDISRLPPAMKHVLLSDLHKLSGLKTLDLGAGSCGWEISETEKHILRGLHCMPQLAQIHLSIDCTDAIVKCVALNCKQLQVLNIPNSRSVTERCIPYLVLMRELRQVFVTHTSITEDGYTRILSSLPHLRNMGKCEYITGVVQRIQVRGHALHLTHLESGKIDEDTLSSIVSLCPRLVNLTLHDVHALNLSCLSHLKHLKSLALINGNIEKMNLLPYLESHGKLECLHLKGVHTIDELTLMRVSDACPYLTILTLDTCECSARREVEAVHNLKHKRYFSNLQTLTCYTTCPTEHLEILLRSSHNMKSIVMGNSTIPNDAFVLKILRFNPFPMLNDLKISHSHTLSMAAVRALIGHCPSLKVLVDLRTWYLIPDSEYRKLKQDILDQNLSLTISLMMN